MTTTTTATDRTEIREQFRELLKVVRLFKHQTAATGATVPDAMVGVLSSITAMSVEPGHPTGGCHVKDLAVRNGLDPSTVSRVVAGLVHLGLVRRAADPTDRRAIFLAPTDAGRAALDQANGRYDALLAGLLRDWPPADLAAFTDLLRRFNRAALTRLADPTPSETTPSETTPSETTLEAAR